MRTVYREKRYFCGEYLSVYIYPVFATGKRGEKRKPSTSAQKKLNQRHREEKLVRLLHANFTPEDLEIHLTYRGEQPESDEEAARNLRNYIRRIQRLRKKTDLPPLKYIAVTERGKRGGRYHHHITVNGGVDRDTLENMWEHGRANSRRLQFDENGLAGLGNYIVKNPVGGKAWTASKNLADPEPVKRDGRISGRKARELAKSVESGEKFEQFECLYPNWLLSEAEAFHNDVNGGCYLTARFYRKDGKFIKPKKPKRKKKPKGVGNT